MLPLWAGAMHYWRHPVTSWRPGLEAMRAMGLRVLDTFRSRGPFETSAQVWSADPSGAHLLVAGGSTTGQVTKGGIVKNPVLREFLYRIDRGRVTALPDPGGLMLAAAW